MRLDEILVLIRSNPVQHGILKGKRLIQGDSLLLLAYQSGIRILFMMISNNN